MTFTQEKGWAIARSSTVGLSVVVHERTDRRLIDWLDEAIQRAQREKAQA